MIGHVLMTSVMKVVVIGILQHALVEEGPGQHVLVTELENAKKGNSVNAP